ncbi:Ankyrin repeat-containing protein ITN1 [Camellia lanceoleosa]|uniref:Ankyrin repeat-containing protein ITN1 n=1 Tax=Camellia lanceoleosa TaxID=1840588 RepID=A0ACC0GWY9_9ERIC|nr:Ankyrin repeat-containing protein ITN1 [Camellia lanceoleosa]
MVDVLRELVQAMPQAARARVDHGDTILHLCVKFCQTEALNLLLETMDAGLKTAKNCHGNTILHLVVAHKQSEIVKYLLTNGIDVNATNVNGYTTLDILAQNPSDVQDCDFQNCLQEAGGLKAVEHDQAIPFPATASNRQIPSFLRAQSILNNGYWLVKKRDQVMVVAVVLATMALRVGISPPGGVWKKDSITDIPNPYKAGQAVVAYNYPGTYKYYVYANMVGFLVPLSTIMLLIISGLPLKRKRYMWILMVIMWLSSTSIAFIYAFSIVAVTQIQDREPIRRTMYATVSIWCGVMTLLLLWHTICLIMNTLRQKRSGNKAIEKCFKFS